MREVYHDGSKGELKLKEYLNAFFNTWFDYNKQYPNSTKIMQESLMAHSQLLTLINSQEQPRGEDVKKALKWLDEVDVWKGGYEKKTHPIFVTIRKALIHCGNMPKEAYRYNEKLTREETT